MINKTSTENRSTSSVREYGTTAYQHPRHGGGEVQSPCASVVHHSGQNNFAAPTTAATQDSTIPPWNSSAIAASTSHTITPPRLPEVWKHKSVCNYCYHTPFSSHPYGIPPEWYFFQGSTRSPAILPVVRYISHPLRCTTPVKKAAKPERISPGVWYTSPCQVLVYMVVSVLRLILGLRLIIISCQHHRIGLILRYTQESA